MAKSAMKAGGLRRVPLEEGAAYIGKNRRWLRERITEGTITGYRLGGGRLIFVDLDEIDAMLRPIPTLAASA